MNKESGKRSREIGGYLELERFSGPMMHEDALALSSGRACLSYLIEQRDIRKLLLPDLLCDAVTKVCEERGVAVRRYAIGEDLRPQAVQPEEDEWLYLVNYYGQLTKEELLSWANRSSRLIVDNAQAYFSAPVKGADTLYTCRKFLGVADGGFLYTDAPPRALEADESHGRMGFVLGRFERPAGEFFAEAAANNDRLPTKAMKMSALTGNLLHAVDYYAVRDRRTWNYRMLHEAFQDLNRLSVRRISGAYAYPLRLAEGEAIRKELIRKKIYVPQLWPNVLQEQPEDSTACRLTREILPLPCDHRYGREEMAYIIDAVFDCLN